MKREHCLIPLTTRPNGLFETISGTLEAHWSIKYSTEEEEDSA